ncbi:uncharacterized protein LOC111312959 [Durio zibethinus]|uniref:Uncharacterized protein LOC111312959 n=1 Tax=Durio zibethinus TaxID=66656 RepID=A0A6P6AXK0_DURZI|nr:uncharacterized protein LOC111312959 [Durio zibethinus]
MSAIENVKFVKVFREANGMADALTKLDVLQCSCGDFMILLSVGRASYPPSEGFLNFNVDGAARGKPGQSGCGGVPRNEEGQVVALFSGPLGIQDSNIAELMAIKMALEILRDIDKLIQEVGNVKVTNIYRKESGMADSLAKAEVERMNMFTSWW